MNEPDENSARQNLKWPWFAAAAVVLGIVMAVIFMTFAVKKVESERDFSAPLPSSAPTH
jgi:hypothetical protein